MHRAVHPLLIALLLCAAPGCDEAQSDRADASLDASGKDDAIVYPDADSGGADSSDAGSTADPDAGSTAGPDAGSTAGPDAGSTADPDAGSTADPDAGSIPDPDTGSIPDPDAGSSTPDLGGTALPPPAGYTTSQLIFEDDFTSPSLDTSKWNPWLGDDTYGRWGNNGTLPAPYSGMNCDSTCSTTFQIMYYDPYPYGHGTSTTGDHLRGGNGVLALIAEPSSHFSILGYSWASAAVTSYSKAYLPAAGGYVQWRAKMPDSRYGGWAGLWLLSPGGAELDVQESGYLDGATPVNNVLASNWHGSGGSQVIQDTGTDLSIAYHTYGVEYRPGQWWKVYLDGQLMATWTSGVPTNAAYQVIIDLEIAGPLAAGWRTVSDPVNHPGPFELDVSAVQIYSLPP